MIALFSVWLALGCLLTSITVAIFRRDNPEAVLTILPYTIALSVTMAAAVLWGHRQFRGDDPQIAGQRLQAVAAIAMNSLSFAILLVVLHGIGDAAKGLGVEGGFLIFVYWLYTRVLVPDDKKTKNE
jgi:hypothetical protein